MPYQSLHKKAIVAAQRTFHAASALFVVGHVLSNASLVDVEDPHFACFYRAKFRLKCMVESHYSTKRKHRSSEMEGTKGRCVCKVEICKMSSGAPCADPELFLIVFPHNDCK